MAAGLVFVAAVRAIPLPWVFHRAGIVLSSNDPYMYRYYVERLTGEANLLDIGILARLPEGVAHGEPLMVSTLWLATELLGGSATAAGVVLAVYPIVSAVVTGWLVYLLATRLTNDRRVGLAALLLFAVVPGHAFRTGLGFADHHAFDYPWLALTALAVVLLLSGRNELRRPWITGALVGVGVAGQTLAWEAGPLLLAPLGIGLFGAAVLAVRGGTVDRLRPVVGGLWMGAALVGLAHVALGWQRLPVATAPALLAVGTTGLWVGAVAVRRIDPPAPAAVFGTTALLAGAVSVTVVATTMPETVATARSGADFLVNTPNIAETRSLIEQWGPAFGPLVMLGFTPVFALPAMGWALWRAWRDADPGWAVTAAYAWSFLALALLQRRFTGELAAFLAVFGGLGFLTLLWWLELVRPPAVFRQDRQSGVSSIDDEILADGDGHGSTSDSDSVDPEGGDESPDLQLPSSRRAVVLGAFGLVFTGFPTAYTAEIHSRVAVDDEIVAAAEAMRTDADARGLGYPERYVLSAWGRNRVYNYFVSGESRSYSFARRRYDQFLSSDAAAWYDEFRDRVGYVVVRAGEGAGGFGIAGTYANLFRSLGSRDGPGPGLAHYRALYASEDGDTKAFTLVPGATLVGTLSGSDGAPVTAAVEVSIPGATFDYVRSTTPDDDGRFELTVAHPGEYRVAGARVTVPERAVLEDETVEVDSDEG